MKPLFWFIGTAMFVCTICVNADYSADLISGGEDPTTLGVVNVWNDTETLYVEYEPVENWYVTMAKVTLTDTSAGNGNGKKKNATRVKLTEGPWIAEIDISSHDPGDSVLLSAHAILATDGGEGGWVFTEGELAVTPLFTYDIGMPSAQLRVVVEGENLVVYFEDTFGMPFKDIRLYVGETSPDLVVPELYPYQHLDLGYVLTDQFVIPLADLGITGEADLYIAAEGIVGFPGGVGEFYDMTFYTEQETFVTITGTTTPGTGDPDEQGAWAVGDSEISKSPKDFDYILE